MPTQRIFNSLIHKHIKADKPNDAIEVIRKEFSCSFFLGGGKRRKERAEFKSSFSSVF